MEIVWQSEIDEYASAVLRKHWPNVPNLGDIKDIDPASLPSVDLICGGYPCQPFSVAGKRQGQADDRHLWPYMRQVVAALRPSWVLCENVAGHVTMGLDVVLSDLENLGYAVQPLIIPACAVDAKHRRDRVWILANTDQFDGNVGRHGTSTICGKWPEAADLSRGCEVIPDSNESGLERRECQVVQQCATERLIGQSCTSIANTDSQQTRRIAKPREEYCQWLFEPGVGGTIDGFSCWLDRNQRLTNETHKRIMSNGNTIMGGKENGAETETRSGEVLRILRDETGTENVQRDAGRHGRVYAQKILLTYLRKLQETSKTLDYLPFTGGEIQEGLLRGVWVQDESASASHRSETGEQRAREYTNAVQALSRLLAHDGKKAWEAYCGENASALLRPWDGNWEDGVTRVAHGIPRRVDRLKALGNAVVPQVAYEIGRAIMAAHYGYNINPA